MGALRKKVKIHWGRAYHATAMHIPRDFKAGPCVEQLRSRRVLQFIEISGSYESGFFRRHLKMVATYNGLCIIIMELIMFCYSMLAHITVLLLWRKAHSRSGVKQKSFLLGLPIAFIKTCQIYPSIVYCVFPVVRALCSI